MSSEVNNVHANLIKKDCFGGGTPTRNAQPENIELFDPSGLPYEPVNGTKIGENKYALDELTVTAAAPPKKGLQVAAAIDAPKEIKLTSLKPTAADIIAKCGGKLQKREVDGMAQEIAIVKNGKEEQKFLVNEDGTLGEQLITVSTFGKNTYITQAAHNSNIKRYFPNGLPDGVEIEYARNGKQYSPIFKKGGEPISTKELDILIAQQATPTHQDDLAQL